MTKQEYIDFLTATSQLVSPYIHEKVNKFECIDPELHAVIMHVTQRRLGKPLLKPALLRAAYELCGGTEWERIIPACAAFELINISSYQANSAFDNKLQVLTEKEKDSQLIAAMCTRELAHACIVELASTISQEQTAWLLNALARSNEYIYIAQHYDLNLLCVANYSRYADDEQHFLDDYTKRCYYGSGIFSGQCAAAGAVLAGASEVEVDALRNFGESYGTGLHMINDLGDYVPASPENTLLKDYQDQFSDLRNGRLTFPLYYLMCAQSQIVSSIFSTVGMLVIDDVNQELLVRELLVHGVVERICMFARSHMRTAKVFLGHFIHGEAMDRLKIMTASAKTNKYLHAYRQIASRYK